MTERHPETRYRVLSADFLTAAHSLKDLPAPDRPEVVFAGRSNSGKSTLLNALCGQKALARVSKTPGRTQSINYFTVRVRKESAGGPASDPFELYFVDLPGYGHADVSRSMRRQWSELLSSYFATRENIALIVVLADCRRTPTEQEEWFFSFDTDALYVLTKADKISKNKAGSLRAAAAKQLGITLGAVFLTSAGAKAKTGVERLCTAMLELAESAAER